ncbi:hypothetical protein GA0115240_176016 [Streptomyces sp. DvalAA-14]|uniref:hypothetical protein n=1 Tax=unclassified Streptomyces TaxID=2593676 RepID=UPI00081B647E|nr:MULTISPECIES: hypothetical protein [unclassified Streptomyces]MYS25197.1 hypothetical protein [Streptomyces sp. SID4948]SCE52867.1 hypothetical protein GA0115240_176016 [Streptomyces sp. DvalAA-14]
MRSVPPVVPPSSPLADPDSLEQLIGDSRRMAPHWKTPAATAQAVAAPVGPHGISVSAASAHLVDGMSEYGD